jgi:CubicO group peptidase (beta-lactamase class C family)
VHARRAIVPLILLAAYAYVHCGSRTPLELPSADVDMPRATTPLVTADVPRTLEELQRRIAGILERDQIAGVAIALVDRDGSTWVGGLGVRDREKHAPMQDDTVFRVGSLSKTFVALGVMRLVDQGKLDIDRPLREILPDVAIENPWEDVAPVTLAQCLEHTAGLDDVRFNEVFTDDEQLSVRDTLRINPRSRRVRWRPGTRHAYSNVGYTVAARAIEVASGEPFDQYLRREIMAPMGIVDADFARTSAITPRLATGYLDEATPAAFQMFAHRPSGALLISACDLAKLVHFWIRRGDGYPPIVSPAGLARIERSGTLPYGHLDGEYGLANYGDVQHPVFGRGHDGGMPGFHSSFRYFPEPGVGYVMLLNSNYAFRGYFEIRTLLFAYLTQGRTFAKLEPAPAPTHGERPGAEYFAYASPRSDLFAFMDRVVLGWHVDDTHDALRVTHLFGWTYELVPTADGAYRRRHENGSSVRFATNADGTPVIFTGLEYGEAAGWWAAWYTYAALALTMILLHIAPLWAVGILGLSVLQRRQLLPLSLVLWPAIAGLACPAVPRVLELSFFRGVIGVVHPLTIAICALTVLFAIASTASLIAVIRWSRRPDRPRLALRLFPTACALAFFSLALWLAANGWVGLRTWAW